MIEKSIGGDIGLVKAHKADKSGNLIYRRTSRTCNPELATACKYVIAEVDEIVETGELDPDHIHTPGIYVDAIVKREHPLPIEKLPKDPKH